MGFRVGVGFSHEVTTGDSHGREPVEQYSTVASVLKGRQATTRNSTPIVPSGLSVRLFLLTLGLAPEADACRHFVTNTHSAWQPRIYFKQCFCFSKSFTALGKPPDDWLAQPKLPGRLSETFRSQFWGTSKSVSQTEARQADDQQGRRIIDNQRSID